MSFKTVQLRALFFCYATNTARITNPSATIARKLFLLSVSEKRRVTRRGGEERRGEERRGEEEDMNKFTYLSQCVPQIFCLGILKGIGFKIVLKNRNLTMK